MWRLSGAVIWHHADHTKRTHDILCHMKIHFAFLENTFCIFGNTKYSVVLLFGTADHTEDMTFCATSKEKYKNT